MVNSEFILGEKDKKLAHLLLNKTETVDGSDIFQGDTHGKFQRGIMAWLHINMPIFMWAEIDTYTVGTSPISSESTMYTLKKEIRNNTTVEEFYEFFSDSTSINTVSNYLSDVQDAIQLTDTKDLSKVDLTMLKADLPSGWLQARMRCFSYQSLRRLYIQRKNHRLPQWQHFIKAIEELPYFDELIMGR
jgi:hypothetical protein